MRLGIVIQARMGSERFPGKVLENLAGTPVIKRLVDRLAQVSNKDIIIVATSDLTKDDELAEFCKVNDIPCFRGSEDNVLGRYLAASLFYNLDVVVRVCADSPLTDPVGIDELIQQFNLTKSKFIHNRHPKGWPVGTASDLISIEALIEADKKATNSYQREHVTPYFLEREEEFKTKLVYGPVDWLVNNYCFAIDYLTDMEWFSKMLSSIEIEKRSYVTIPEVLHWIEENEIYPREFLWPNSSINTLND